MAGCDRLANDIKTKGGEMAALDLGKLEERLNDKMANDEFKQAFFKDPAGTLKSEGLILPSDKEKTLIELVKRLNMPVEGVPGSSLRRPGIRFVIHIGIDF